MTETLPSLLQSLGFTKKEATVYLAIQKQGRVLPVDLAEITGINRTTVYSVVKALLAKRVVIEDLGSPKRELLATAPEELAHLLERQLKEIKQKQTIVDEAVTLVRSLAGEAAYPVPKIQFVKEDQIEAFLYDRTSVWNDSILKTKSLYLGFQEEAFVEQFADWINWYWENTPKEIHLRLLSNDSKAERHVAAQGHKRREIIFWKENLQFSATTWVMGDYVVMFVLSSSPNYLVEIHDARFAENQRALFEGILEHVDARGEKA